MGITNASFAALSGLAGNTGSQTAFTYLANGSGSTAFAAAQTALVSENSGTGSDRVAASVSRVTTTQTNDTLQLTTTWTLSGSKTIREVGIFNAASTGVMLARTVLAADKSLVSGETYALTYKVKFA